VAASVPKGNYALIGGDPGQTGSTQMQEGYHAVLDPLVAKGDIKIVLDQFSSGWKTEAAQAHAENALTQNDNKIDAFLVSYDGMSVGVLQAIDGAGIAPGSIPVTGQDMELAAAQAIVEGRMFGSVWPAPDEMAVAGANAAVAMAQCKDIGATDKINNKAADIPWVKTPIYLISQKEMPDFICSHKHWLDIDEVYKNVPDKKPTCQ
jgi:D-xylose transport system substrate-binding protein